MYYKKALNIPYQNNSDKKNPITPEIKSSRRECMYKKFVI